MPVDQYQKSMRRRQCTDRNLSFLALFMVEVKKIRIHRSSIITVGAALIIYYTLLPICQERLGYVQNAH